MIASTLTSHLVSRQSVTTLTLSRQGEPLLRAYDANTFFRRLRGLHGCPPLQSDEALVIRPCSSIQTVGMASTIDVAFLDGKGRILKLATVAPGRLAACAGASVVLEMTDGTANRLALSVGQTLVPDSGRWT